MQFLPWYNSEVINFLNNYLTNKMDVFEYGGGNSTLYYAGKVASVSTIEAKTEWFDFVLFHRGYWSDGSLDQSIVVGIRLLM